MTRASIISFKLNIQHAYPIRETSHAHNFKSNFDNYNDILIMHVKIYKKKEKRKKKEKENVRNTIFNVPN